MLGHLSFKLALSIMGIGGGTLATSIQREHTKCVSWEDIFDKYSEL
jgi:hypothetical protein